MAVSTRIGPMMTAWVLGIVATPDPLGSHDDQDSERSEAAWPRCSVNSGARPLPSADGARDEQFAGVSGGRHQPSDRNPLAVWADDSQPGGLALGLPAHRDETRRDLAAVSVRAGTDHLGRSTPDRSVDPVDRD